MEGSEPLVKSHSMPVYLSKADKPSREQNKQELVFQKDRLDDLKAMRKTLKSRAFSKCIGSRGSTEIVLCGKKLPLFLSKDRQKLGIADRIKAYQQLERVEKHIKKTEHTIEQLEGALRGRIKAKAYSAGGVVGGKLVQIFRYGAEGRAVVAPAAGPIPNPMLFYQAGLDTIWLFVWARDGAKHFKEARRLRDLIQKSDIRLQQIDHKLELNVGDASELRALREEKTSIQGGLAIIKEEYSRDALSISIQQTFSNILKVVYSYGRLIQAFSMIIPFLVHSGTLVTLSASVGLVTSVVTIPIAAYLSIRGISAALRNLKNAKADRAFAHGVRRRDLEVLTPKLEALNDICRLPELDDHPKLKQEIHAANESIQALQAAVKAIDHLLLDGIKDKTVVANRKAERARFKDEITALRMQAEELTHAELRDCSNAQGRAELAHILSHFQAKTVMVENSASLQNTLLLYVEQKCAIKIVQERLRLLAECMTITCSILITSGLVLSAVHGTGVPLLVAGVITGFAVLAVQIPLSMLVKWIQKTCQGKSRISTKQFNEEFRNRLAVEVANWDALEASGMTQATTAAMMFHTLSKHYKAMPDGWGPKEWANALVNDPPDGKQWKRYNWALLKMRNHDDSHYLGRRLVEAIGRMIKKKHL